MESGGYRNWLERKVQESKQRRSSNTAHYGHVGGGWQKAVKIRTKIHFWFKNSDIKATIKFAAPANKSSL